MHPILAISILTFREAVRKKSFLLLILFGLALAAMSFLFPSTGAETAAERRTFLILAWAVRGLSFFGMILSTFLAALSLPEDFEDRRIFQVMVKPVRPVHLATGKVVGFGAVLACFLGVTGGMSLACVYAVANTGVGEDILWAKEAIPATRFEFSSGSGTVVGGSRADDEGYEATLQGDSENGFSLWEFVAPPGGTFPEPLPLRLRMGVGQGAGAETDVTVRLFDQRMKKLSTGKATVRDGMETEFSMSRQVPEEEGVFLGRSGAIQVQIRRRHGSDAVHLDRESVDLPSWADGRPRLVTWRFLAERGPEQVDGSWTERDGWRLRLAGPTGDGGIAWRFDGLSPEVLSAPAECEAQMRLTLPNFRTSARVEFGFLQPSTSRSHLVIHPVQYRKPTRLAFPIGMVDEGGSLIVRLRRPRPELGIEADAPDVRLLTRRHSFLGNFARSLVLLFCQLMIVAACAVGGSTFLSGPVNLFLALVIYLAGSLIGFLKDAMSSVRHQIAQAALPDVGGGAHSHDATADLPGWVLQLSDHILSVVFRIVPDFQTMDPGPYLMLRREIPDAVLLHGLGVTALYAAAAVLVGWLALSRKDYQ